MDKRSILFMVCVSISFFAVNTIYDYYVVKPKAPKEQVVVIPKALVKKAEVAAAAIDGGEEFFVLENEYQQLVFSSKGAALAEINLPLRTGLNKSYVKEIHIDRMINAEFPRHKATDFDGKVVAKQRGGYYPLLRTGTPDVYAMSLADGENFTVKRFEKELIEFEANFNGVKIVKTYRLDEKPYFFTLDVETNKEGLWLCSGVPDAEIVSNSYSPQIRYQSTKANALEVETVDLPKGELATRHIAPNWISNSNGFLGVLIHPVENSLLGFKTALIDGLKIPSRLAMFDHKVYPHESYPGYAAYLPVKKGVNSYKVFAGPYDSSLLAQLDEAAKAEGENPDYESAVEIQGWFSFISQPFSELLNWLMNLFYSITQSWALSIILLTISLKVMMWPLNTWSVRSNVKTQQIAPKVKAIQDRYKKDPKKAQVEVMNLYRESGVNPLMGCLPILLQMPFLVGMFYLLKSSVPLRGAVFIPGWIDDLSAPDVLFSWTTPIWLVGNQFHLLPVLMGLTMFLQQKLTTKFPDDPNEMTDQQKQQKMMGSMMAVLFTVMFYNFPSGLNIYFMLSTLLGLGQQMWVTKRMQPVMN